MWKFQIISVTLVLAIEAIAFEDAVVEDRVLNGEGALEVQFSFVTQVTKIVYEDRVTPAAAIIDNRLVLMTAVYARLVEDFIAERIVRFG